MKFLALHVDRPRNLPAQAALYALTPKTRYERSGPCADGGGRFAEAAFLTDSPVPIPGAFAAFPVDDRLQFSRAGAGPGRGGVMRLLFLKRAAQLDRQGFARHWRAIHAPLALDLGPSFDHYVTNIVTDAGCEWDGILQEWFASEAMFDHHELGLAGHKKTVADDIPLFVAAVADSPQFLGREL
jgi:hypothetical protein